LLSGSPSVHPAGIARVGLLIRRVRRLSRPDCQGGAPGERQYDKERGKPSLPVHPFPPRRPIRRAYQP